MSGNDGKTPQAPPTPQERVAGQVAVTDGVQSVMSVMHDAFGFGSDRAFSVSDKLAKDLHVAPGSTHFEEHRLNAMLDLVEGTKPGDLENAGTALFKASQAMTDAATELRTNLKHASDDFQGEAGVAFQQWGSKLAGHTDALSGYVQTAGVEIAAAATGLASVKSSLPPRDTRPTHKAVKPEALPADKRTAGDPDYDEAVKVEKHRQEAINQMNRLASFYSVSAETLGSLEPPTFETMPNVGVPKPEPTGGFYSDGNAGRSGDSGPGPAASAGREHLADPTTPAVSAETRHVTPDQEHASVTLPDRPVGTDLNSVGTLPTPTTSTPSPQTPVSPAGPGPSGTPGPFPMGPAGLPGASTGRFGGGANKAPFAAQGRAQTSGSSATSRGPQGRGATNTPLGRAGGPGTQGGMQGGRPTSTARGVTGGTPRPNGANPARSAGPGTTGAARSNGVVGGRPSAPQGAGQSGSRTPRGTVMGTGGPGNARGTAGRIGQRGVLGVPGTETTGRPTGAGRQVPGASEAVTGRPAGRTSAARAGRNGFTSGGEGLVRGPQRRDRREDDQEGTERPDYLVEDEATHLPQQPRRDVPPVID
ncbi:hypothetical protein [Streptomyces sp. NPDC049813]|uniref:hypothetical protein n=1 Tax=Streptomyces sp. NPDC049813 TaxID=3365597 RepID=UPI0037B731AF